ncbi:sugar transferase [Microbacterium sediminicola]|uniref:Sugar transferase n=1 Tax=Microbacterium sediminicola TaxID=415210 RepID=A0ABP4TG74_9MICO
MTPDARWPDRLASYLFFADLLVIFVTLFSAQIGWYGFGKPVYLQFPGADQYVIIPFAVPVILLGVLWIFFLWVYRTRDIRILGAGTAEYKRVADLTIRVFGIFGIVAFVFNYTIGQAFLLTGLPLGVLLILLERWVMRRWLVRRRRRDEFKTTAILYGDAAKSVRIAKEIQRDKGGGLAIVGAVTRDGAADGVDLIDGIPIIGSFDTILPALVDSSADALILTGSDSIGANEMRELGWVLEGANVTLIVSPSLTDIAGPRIHATPVAGLPLIHVDFPDTSGPKLWVKRLLDVVASGLAILVFSPLFLILPILIRRDSPGPALFRQERIGLNGKPFKMLKFRSMVSDAEGILASLLDASDGNQVMFKMRDDPRITKIGGFLRRYSLDELPQLLNVFRGEMSLVGPRPPLPSEVEEYDHWAERRLLVKPGITGLWQVSGRSNLDWDDTVRLDLYYVENWSLTGDITIILRTVSAVLKREGAY